MAIKMSKASNAVLALSRTFYGRRLDAKQYESLLSCRNINEIASFLRTSTVYSDAFEGAPAVDFTSKGLKNIIDRYKLQRIISLCRYELAIGSDFYKNFIVKTEVEQILRCTLLIIGGSTEEYMMQFGEFLDRHLSIDLYALGRARSLEEIATALEKTAYEKIFRKCLADPERSYLTFELAFDSYYEQFQYKLAEKCFSGSQQKALLDIISRMHDINYIKKQFRILKYYDGNLAVSNVIVPESGITSFTDKQIKALADCSSEKQLIRILSKTPYRDCIEKAAADGVEKGLYKSIYDLCRKNVRFSSYPAVVMYSYLFLAQNEAANLVKIIEGIKYSIPIDEIRSNLVGIGD